jgi:hypothetical protein
VALDQLGCECWQAIKVAIRPPVFDRHVLCLDVAGFSEASSKALQLWSDRHSRRGWRNPITGVAGCCAPAASGQAAEPAMTLMKSRRRTRPLCQA